MMPFQHEYRKPTNPYVKSEEHKLYQLEGQLYTDFHFCAKELGKVLNFTEGEYRTHSVPEAIRSFLEYQQGYASEIAAVSYLEKRGYHATKSKK